MTSYIWGMLVGDQKLYPGFSAENKAKLRSIRAKYDPSVVLRKLNAGAFRLDSRNVAAEQKREVVA